jgi:hypothetical protein
MPERRDWRRRAAWTHLRPFEQHSRVLLLAGVIYIIIGWQYLGHVRTDRLHALQVALWFTGGQIKVWGIIWVIVGASAVLSARWPYFSTRWGYAGLSGLAAVWFLQYLTGWLILGFPTSLVAAGTCSWALIAMFWWFVAGLVNPNDFDLTDQAAPPAAHDPGG